MYARAQPILICKDNEGRQRIKVGEYIKKPQLGAGEK